MIFFCGLALALMPFIIECEGGNLIGTAKHPIIEASANQSELPNHILEDILYKAGFEAAKKAAQIKIRSRGAINRIFEDNIIIIKPYPHEKHEEIIEFDQKDEHFLKIQDYGKLMRLFHHFGEHVRRIHIYYYYMDDDMRRDINENIIKKYANQLTELEIYTPQVWSESQNERIWQEISNENGEIHFPKVKKFKYTGRISRKSFDVNSILPSIEIFKLHGDVDDINCLANVRHLKELSLNTESIGEDLLVNIIANNKQITKLTLWNSNTIRTVRSIGENLKDLKTLIVKYVGNDFFVPTTNKVYNFTSVTSFSVFGVMASLYRNISFDMPNLENLKLVGWNIDHRITNFVNRFHKLETVYVDGLTGKSSMSCIKSMIHVKEFATIDFGNSKLSSLKDFFENFDKTTSNLKTLKLYNFNFSEYFRYEDTMNEINSHLKEIYKPTWKLSYGSGRRGTSRHYYLIFKRDLNS
ncbi:uncharacterized protein LOC116351022 [Contarinia nasturtii]|uniref:uncharacterized protein LOC116350265 n=1 Tax=Contarinia nasturtii TaxID=265458 RepID=UPI0012D3D496|nr:uncharacterized protein LOC116350265 [Contarinia nasturtii]XP_031638910.1 uncharacterized protein LOC116351022 [Contarinia nasturtii]